MAQCLQNFKARRNNLWKEIDAFVDKGNARDWPAPSEGSGKIPNPMDGVEKM